MGFIDDHFSLRSFAIGMSGVAVIAAALGGLAVMRGETALHERLMAMPSKTAEIAWNTAPESQPIKPPNYVAVDVPAHQDEPAAATTTHEAVPEDHHQEEAVADVPAEPAVKAPPPGVPLEGLFETTEQGKLPVIRQSDKMTSFDAYRRPFDGVVGGKPVVSLAIFDVGLSDSASNAALRAFPPEVSLVLSPYMTTPDLWVTEARTRGHELWLSLPVEVKDYPLVDPGPQTALIGAAEKDNLAKLYWVMSRATNYVGFVTPPDPTFIKAEQDMRPVMNRIYGRGLAFVDGSLMPSLIPKTMAQSMNAPYGTIDVWVDAPAEKESIAESLAQVEKLARDQGFAAAVIRPYPLSYQMVQEWVASLPSKGIVLAPLSAQAGR